MHEQTLTLNMQSEMILNEKKTIEKNRRDEARKDENWNLNAIEEEK